MGYISLVNIILRGNSLSASCPRANYLGDNFWASNFRGVNYPGGNYPGGKCPGGNFPGGNCLGGNYQGGNCPVPNKDMVKIKTVVIIIKILANFIVQRNFIKKPD